MEKYVSGAFCQPCTVTPSLPCQSCTPLSQDAPVSHPEPGRRHYDDQVEVNLHVEVPANSQRASLKLNSTSPISGKTLILRGLLLALWPCPCPLWTPPALSPHRQLSAWQVSVWSNHTHLWMHALSLLKESCSHWGTVYMALYDTWVLISVGSRNWNKD